MLFHSIIFNFDIIKFYFLGINIYTMSIKTRYLTDKNKEDIANSIKNNTPFDIRKLVYGKSVKSNYVKHKVYKPEFDIKKITKPSKNLLALSEKKKKKRGRPKKVK